ncbi:MAG: hypothetical protein EOO44_01400 [Flavobacterium sp.]|nr:MAG: hypothetical protein EOO44_01400 [Flavobacterium sp.]
MEIKYLDAYKSTLELNEALWKVSSKKTTIVLAVLFAFSIFLSVYSNLNSTEFSKSESYHSSTQGQVSVYNNYSNRHALESIGIVLIVFVILIFYYNRIRKKTFFIKAEESAIRFLETGNTYSIQINKDFIEYNSVDLLMKINWIKFSKYKIYKDYIFIGYQDYVSTIGIDKRLLNKTELEDLFQLFKEKNIQNLK